MEKENAIEFFAALFGGEHHFLSEVKPHGTGWKIQCHTGIATYDFDFLTRLVFLAHDKCVRAEIGQSAPRRLAIYIWQRKRSGSIMERHPTIDEALKEWRKKYPVK